MSSKRISDALAPDIFPSAGAGLFGRRQRRVRGSRIPVTLVTGFLGAGKTTLVKHFLESPAGARTAVVVNEFGEVGIDHALLRASSDNMVLLGNGCLCCSVRSDLEETLAGLLAQSATGDVPGFDRIVIESSGLADPGPILQTFDAQRGIGREFHLGAVVTVVDAVNGPELLATAPEAARQVALADRLLISKTDLVEADAVEKLKALLAERNPTAVVHVLDHGAADAEAITEPADLPRETPHGHVHHSAGITSFSLAFDAPISWAAFSHAMDTLMALKGADILRVKGLLAVEGCDGPIVIHAVQHVMHPPTELLDWPDTGAGEDRSGRLVFITKGLGREAVAALFEAIRGLEHDPEKWEPVFG